MTSKRSRRPQPLAPPPQAQALRSRKRARQVTTLFHKYTQERDAAVARAKAAGAEGNSSHLTPIQLQLLEDVRKIDDKIAAIGGRKEYQRASQMNTSMFSTSKWVLGILGRWGWLDGLPVERTKSTTPHERMTDGKEKPQRRDVRLLEVGAVNTQLIDAAARTKTTYHVINNNNSNNNKQNTIESNGNNLINKTERVYCLDVKAIDIRSTDPRIQQTDFFDLHLNHDPGTFYDVIVISMVINCVTTPAQRGKMLHLCYKYLRPGGVCFLTLPKLCLIQSKFMSRSYFEEILTRGLGFDIMQEVGRDSPKIAFFVLRRPAKSNSGTSGMVTDKFTQMPVLHRGKQFRNTFAVILNADNIL